MRKLFVPLLIATAAMFAYAPIAIANAPYESTMLLVQKIFYFHFSTWIAVTAGLVVCGLASAVYLFKGSARADRIGVAAAELVVVFALFGMVSGSLWARKAWGVWWQWDARLTMAFLVELIFCGYLLVRKFGGPGAEKLAAAMGIFGAASAPFVYKSVDWWRTVHPKTSVMRTLTDTPGGAVMWGVVWFCTAAFMLLFVSLLIARMRLQDLRADLDQLYLAAED
jgi:heme exporter protein C